MVLFDLGVTAVASAALSGKQRHRSKEQEKIRGQKSAKPQNCKTALGIVSWNAAALMGCCVGTQLG